MSRKVKTKNAPEPDMTILQSRAIRLLTLASHDVLRWGLELMDEPSTSLLLAKSRLKQALKLIEEMEKI